MMRLFKPISVAALLVAAAPAAAQQKYNLTLAGASPGGLWSIIHAGVNKAFVAAFPGSVITYRTSGGGFANIPMVSAKRVDLGLAHDGEMKAALDGAPPFKKATTNVRTVAVIYNDAVAMQLLMTKSFADAHGIATFADIARKKPPVRAAFNRRGNLVYNIGAEFFRAIGVSVDDIQSWGGRIEYAGSRQAIQLMKDRRVDLLVGGEGYAPGRGILEVARTTPLVLLTPAKDVARKAAERTGTGYAEIKGGTYGFQPEDVPTAVLTAAVIINADAADQVAYDLAKAMIEKLDQFKSAHRYFRGLTAKVVASDFTVPYHPGAERYYKEAGLR